MKKKNLFLGVLFLGLVALATMSCSKNANSNEPIKTITVIGNSLVSTEPDKVIISFAVNEKDKSLTNAKKKNDAIIQKVNTTLEKFNIEKKHVAIQRINVHPRYSYRNDVPRFMHYEIRQNISVTITKIENYEPFLEELLSLGIERIDNISFSVNDIKKYKNEARTTAVSDARNKAELFCTAASNDGKKIKLGKVLQISEYPQQGFNSYGGDRFNNYARKELAMDDSEGGSDFSPSGEIQIKAQVEIVFEIE